MSDLETISVDINADLTGLLEGFEQIKAKSVTATDKLEAFYSKMEKVAERVALLRKAMAETGSVDLAKFGDHFWQKGDVFAVHLETLHMAFKKFVWEMKADAAVLKGIELEVGKAYFGLSGMGIPKSDFLTIQAKRAQALRESSSTMQANALMEARLDVLTVDREAKKKKAAEELANAYDKLSKKAISASRNANLQYNEELIKPIKPMSQTLGVLSQQISTGIGALKRSGDVRLLAENIDNAERMINSFRTGTSKLRTGTENLQPRSIGDLLKGIEGEIDLFERHLANLKKAGSPHVSGIEEIISKYKKAFEALFSQSTLAQETIAKAKQAVAEHVEAASKPVATPTAPPVSAPVSALVPDGSEKLNAEERKTWEAMEAHRKATAAKAAATASAAAAPGATGATGAAQAAAAETERTFNGSQISIIKNLRGLTKYTDEAKAAGKELEKLIKSGADTGAVEAAQLKLTESMKRLAEATRIAAEERDKLERRRDTSDVGAAVNKRFDDLLKDLKAAAKVNDEIEKNFGSGGGGGGRFNDGGGGGGGRKNTPPPIFDEGFVNSARNAASGVKAVVSSAVNEALIDGDKANFGGLADTIGKKVSEASNQLRGLRQAFNDVNAAVDPTVKSTTQYSKELAAIESAFGNLGRAIKTASGVHDDFASKAEKQRKQLQALATGAEDAREGFGRLSTGVEQFVAVLEVAKVIQFGEAIVKAAVASQRIQAVTGAAFEGADAQKQLKVLKDIANELGQSYQELATPFVKLGVAAGETNLTLEQTDKIFKSVVIASTAMGLSTQETTGTVRAFEQMLTKGVVQSEEVRRQLGNDLPQAFQLFAKAYAISRGQMTATDKVSQDVTASFEKAMRANKVIAAEVLPIVADLLTNKFGKAAEEMAQKVPAAFARVRTHFTEFAEVIYASGIERGLLNIASALNKALSNNTFISIARDASSAFEGLAKSVNKYSDALLLAGTTFAVIFGASVMVAATASLLSLGGAAVAVGAAVGGAAAAGVGLYAALKASKDQIDATIKSFVTLQDVITKAGHAEQDNEEKRKSFNDRVDAGVTPGGGAAPNRIADPTLSDRAAANLNQTLTITRDIVLAIITSFSDMASGIGTTVTAIIKITQGVFSAAAALLEWTGGLQRINTVLGITKITLDAVGPLFAGLVTAAIIYKLQAMTIEFGLVKLAIEGVGVAAGASGFARGLSIAGIIFTNFLRLLGPIAIALTIVGGAMATFGNIFAEAETPIQKSTKSLVEFNKEIAKAREAGKLTNEQAKSFFARATELETPELDKLRENVKQRRDLENQIAETSRAVNQQIDVSGVRGNPTESAIRQLHSDNVQAGFDAQYNDLKKDEERIEKELARIRALSASLPKDSASSMILGVSARKRTKELQDVHQQQADLKELAYTKLEEVRLEEQEANEQAQAEARLEAIRKQNERKDAGGKLVQDLKTAADHGNELVTALTAVGAEIGKLSAQILGSKAVAEMGDGLGEAANKLEFLREQVNPFDKELKKFQTEVSSPAKNIISSLVAKNTQQGLIEPGPDVFQKAKQAQAIVEGAGLNLINKIVPGIKEMDEAWHQHENRMAALAELERDFIGLGANTNDIIIARTDSLKMLQLVLDKLNPALTYLNEQFAEQNTDAGVAEFTAAKVKEILAGKGSLEEKLDKAKVFQNTNSFESNLRNQTAKKLKTGKEDPQLFEDIITEIVNTHQRAETAKRETADFIKEIEGRISKAKSLQNKYETDIKNLQDKIASFSLEGKDLFTFIGKNEGFSPKQVEHFANLSVINDSLQKLKTLNKEVKKVEEKDLPMSEKIQDSIDELKPALEAASKLTGEFAISQTSLANGLKVVTEAEAAKVIALEQEAAATEKSQRTVRQHVADLEAEAEALGRGERSLKDFREAKKLTELANSTYEQAIKVKVPKAEAFDLASRAVNAQNALDAAEAADKQAEGVYQPFKRAATRIQDAFGTAFESIFEGGENKMKSFGKTMLDLVKKIAADLLAAAVIKPALGGLLNAIGLSQTAQELGLSAPKQTLYKLIQGANGALTAIPNGETANTSKGPLDSLQSMFGIAQNFTGSGSTGGGILDGLMDKITQFGTTNFGLAGGMAPISQSFNVTGQAIGGLAHELGVAAIPGGITNVAAAGTTAVTGAGGALQTPLASGALGTSSLGSIAGTGLGIVGSVLPGLISGNGVQAALGGVGAIAGSFFGPIGTMVGGTIGNLIGSLFGGSQKKAPPAGYSNADILAKGDLGPIQLNSYRGGDTTKPRQILEDMIQPLLKGLSDQYGVRFTGHAAAELGGSTRISYTDGSGKNTQYDFDPQNENSLKDAIAHLSVEALRSADHIDNMRLKQAAYNVSLSDTAETINKMLDFGANFDTNLKSLATGQADFTQTAAAVGNKFGQDVQENINKVRDWTNKLFGPGALTNVPMSGVTTQVPLTVQADGSYMDKDGNIIRGSQITRTQSTGGGGEEGGGNDYTTTTMEYTDALGKSVEVTTDATSGLTTYTKAVEDAGATYYGTTKDVEAAAAAIKSYARLVTGLDKPLRPLTEVAKTMDLINEQSKHFVDIFSTAGFGDQESKDLAQEATKAAKDRLVKNTLQSYDQERETSVGQQMLSNLKGLGGGLLDLRSDQKVLGLSDEQTNKAIETRVRSAITNVTQGSLREFVEVVNKSTDWDGKAEAMKGLNEAIAHLAQNAATATVSASDFNDRFNSAFGKTFKSTLSASAVDYAGLRANTSLDQSKVTKLISQEVFGVVQNESIPTIQAYIEEIRSLGGSFTGSVEVIDALNSAIQRLKTGADQAAQAIGPMDLNAKLNSVYGLDVRNNLRNVGSEAAGLRLNQNLDQTKVGNYIFQNIFNQVKDMDPQAIQGLITNMVAMRDVVPGASDVINGLVAALNRLQTAGNDAMASMSKTDFIKRLNSATGADYVNKLTDLGADYAGLSRNSNVSAGALNSLATTEVSGLVKDLDPATISSLIDAFTSVQTTVPGITYVIDALQKSLEGLGNTAGVASRETIKANQDLAVRAQDAYLDGIGKLAALRVQQQRELQTAKGTPGYDVTFLETVQSGEYLKASFQDAQQKYLGQLDLQISALTSQKEAIDHNTKVWIAATQAADQMLTNSTLSTLTPLQQYQKAQELYQQSAARAINDPNEVSNLISLANQFATVSRAYFASSPQYSVDFQSIQDTLRGLQTPQDQSLRAQLDQLAALNKQIDDLQFIRNQAAVFGQQQIGTLSDLRSKMEDTYKLWQDYLPTLLAAINAHGGLGGTPAPGQPAPVTVPTNPIKPPDLSSFNVNDYLAANPDVREAVKGGVTTGQSQYDQYGQYENRPTTPNSSTSQLNADFAAREQKYLNDNPDVAAAVASGAIANAYSHYLMFGRGEGRAFEMGGYHTGGLRLVGERGAELEATGPARYWSSSQLQDVMSRATNNPTQAAPADNKEVCELLKEMISLLRGILQVDQAAGQSNIDLLEALEDRLAAIESTSRLESAA